MNPWCIIRGDCRDVLATLESESVHCVVTSPPYWGLRDYGVEGQIGHETSPNAFVEQLVAVFSDVRRVLRQDGTLWLNLGDSYARAGGPGWQGKNGQRADRRFTAARDTVAMRAISRKVPDGLKAKDLVGIPWRVAFALQADGWWLRSDIIWSKPNPMPESVTDRPTKAHEYVFLLAKSESYYYDAGAVREPAITEASGNKERHCADGSRGSPADHRGSSVPWVNDGSGRNKRSVWTIPTTPFADEHFATFPEALVEPCIKAGCPAGGIVLDPFAGAGTVGVVALKIGRRFVGIELSERYAEMAKKRIEEDAPLLNRSRPAPVIRDLLRREIEQP